LAGRGQLKWGNIENLKKAIDEYFQKCEESGQAPNVADLCVHLDIHRDTFHYYSSGRYEHRLALEARKKKQELIEAHGEEKLKEITTENDIYQGNVPAYYGTDEIDRIKAQVSDCLKKAKARLEGWVWRKGFEQKNPAMAIFALKAVHGYTDQPQEVNLTQQNFQIQIKIEQNPAKPPTITVVDAE